MRKLQRILNFLSLISMIICLAAILVWMVAASFSKGRRVYHWTDQPRLVRVTIDVDYYWGGQIWREHWEYEDRIGPARPPFVLDLTRQQLIAAIGPADTPHTDWITPQPRTFDWCAVTGAKLRIGRQVTQHAFIPVIAILISLIFPGLWLVDRYYAGKKLLMRTGYCTVCDYNLRGNTTGICPECGTQVRASRSPSSTT